MHAPPTTESPEAPALQPTAPTPLWPIILVSLLLSIGTGILWNGLSFVAEAAFGYGRVETYTLSIVQGLFYVIAAGLAGRIIRALERHLAPRSVLALVLLAQGVVAPIILFSPSSPALWFVACAVSAASALQWPIIESYLTAGRSAKRMRSAIGWWNVVWMGSTLIALALTGVILDAGLPMIAIAAIAPVNLVAAVLLVAFGRAPGTHLHDDEEPVPASYRDHLAAARVLLPVSYVIVAALAPLMPFLTAPFGLTKTERTLVAATWLAGRLLSAAVLWQTQRWHGVWATLGAAGVLMAVGFAVAVLAPTLPLLVVGLALFGLGQGVIYYAAIYYAMRVGHADVDAAGTHEALIGLGYLIGPAIGFLSTLAASEDLVRNQIFVVAIWAVMGAAAIPAVRPWIRSRIRSRTQ